MMVKEIKKAKEYRNCTNLPTISANNVDAKIINIIPPPGIQ